MVDKIILASHNEHKVNEIKMILNDIDIVSLSSINELEEPEENGKDLYENAYIKAKYYYDKFHKAVIADDSWLIVESLDGMPGIFSARYASLGTGSPFHDDNLNRLKLLRELHDKPNRNAHFDCVICLIEESGKTSFFLGQTFGHITLKPYGDNGFGYDSLFFSNDLNKTFGEATNEEKDKVSHRGRALKLLKEYLNGK